MFGRFTAKGFNTRFQIFIVVHYLQNTTLQYLQKLHEIQKEKRDKTIHSQKKNVFSDQSDRAGGDPDRLTQIQPTKWPDMS